MKVCSSCKQQLEASSFSRSSSQADGLATRCRSCDREAGNRYAARLTHVPATAKPCIACGQIKEPECFPKNRRARDGLHTECKPCTRARLRTYKERNRESVLAKKRAAYYKNREENIARSKAYHQRNRESARAKSKAAYLANREERLAASRAYVAANRGEVTARQRAWKKRERERVNAQRRTRRASIRTTGHVTAEQWAEMRRNIRRGLRLLFEDRVALDHGPLHTP